MDGDLFHKYLSAGFVPDISLRNENFSSEKRQIPAFVQLAFHWGDTQWAEVNDTVVGIDPCILYNLWDPIAPLY